MALDLDRALGFLADTHQGILVTIKSDGRPQSSNIVYDLADGVVRISVTDGRAKTANLRRDPRASLHVTPHFGAYVVAEGVASLSEVSTTPGDDVGRRLLEVYEAIAGPHPDPDEFLEAMAADRRLLVSIPVDRAYGMIPPG